MQDITTDFNTLVEIPVSIRLRNVKFSTTKKLSKKGVRFSFSITS